MMRDYPKYAEYIESNCEKGMTEEEAEKWAEDCQVYEDKMQAKIKAMHD